MTQKTITAFFNDNFMRFSSETIRCYKIALKQLFSCIEKEFDKVKATDIRAWLASLEEQGIKPKSIQLKLTVVKSFYHYCIEENLVKKNPTDSIQTPKLDDRLPKYLTKRQLVLLQELARRDIRDRAVVETLFATGVRISELSNIRLEDIKWETRQIWIRKGKGNKERFFLFSYECSERLQAYLNARKIESKYLFCNQRGEKLSSSFFEKKFKEFSDSLGFKVTPHTMRHTFASYLTTKKMPKSYIQELMGHVNINSTHI